MLPTTIQFDKWCDRVMGMYKHDIGLKLQNYIWGGSKNTTEQVTSDLSYRWKVTLSVWQDRNKVFIADKAVS